jgi:hypothetical protein
MTKSIGTDMVFARSNDVVAREIDGMLIIVPLTAGVGDMEDDLFSMNETGTAIWNMLDGKKTIKEIISGLKEEFIAGQGEITKDVTGIVEELLKRRMIVEAASS